MLRVLRNARIPLFHHRKSNHIFTVWQHMVLLVIRQYEMKSYRMFAEWLAEAYYLRTFLQLSHVPHLTTLQKFTGYSKLLYSQRNKDETILSVIKRLFGEHITSRLVRTQNRELSFRCIAYNAHRLTNLSIIIDDFYKAGSLQLPYLCLWVDYRFYLGRHRQDAVSYTHLTLPTICSV